MGAMIGLDTPVGTASSWPSSLTSSEGFSRLVSSNGYGVIDIQYRDPFQPSGNSTMSGCTLCPDPSYVGTTRISGSSLSNGALHSRRPSGGSVSGETSAVP